jgi:hypothetical protein
VLDPDDDSRRVVEPSFEEGPKDIELAEDASSRKPVEVSSRRLCVVTIIRLGILLPEALLDTIGRMLSRGITLGDMATPGDGGNRLESKEAPGPSWDDLKKSVLGPLQLWLSGFRVGDGRGLDSSGWSGAISSS